jgi:hypothetical protein
MNRLLILACSQKKNPAPGPLPAVERYDGPAFRVLRRFLRECPGGSLTVLILSAEYGLIESGRPIGAYDRRMSPARVRELREPVLAAAEAALSSGRWQSVAVCAGREYRRALDGIREVAPTGVPVDFLGGGLGRRLTNLSGWLWGGDSGASA